jgi:hypothetical protein
MHPINFKHALLASAVLAAIAAIALWSWNTLATLFSLPAADMRHAVAALLLLATLRGLLLPGHPRRRRRRWHGAR